MEKNSGRSPRQQNGRIMPAKQNPRGAKCNSACCRQLGPPQHWRASHNIGRNSRFFQSCGGRGTPTSLSAEANKFESIEDEVVHVNCISSPRWQTDAECACYFGMLPNRTVP